MSGGPPIGAVASPLRGNQQTGMPAWGKILLGCGVGCAALALIAVGAGIYGLWWVFSPGKQVATDIAIAPDTVAVVSFSGGDKSQGLAELLGVLMSEATEAARRQRPVALPKPLRFFEELSQAQPSQSAIGVQMMLPREATLAFVPGDGGRLHSIMAANFQTFLRPLRALMVRSARGSKADGHINHHGNFDILGLRNGGVVSFVGGTLVWADDEALLDATLDRATITSRPLPAIVDLSTLDALRRRYLVACVVDNRTGLLAHLTEPWSNASDVSTERDTRDVEDLLPQVQRLTLGLRLPSSDRAEAELTLSLPGDTAVRELQSALQAELDAARTAAGRHKLALDWTTTPGDGRLEAKITVTGLVELARRSADHAFRTLPPPPPTTAEPPLPEATPGS